MVSSGSSPASAAEVAPVQPPATTAVCASCATPLHGPYCHACGEKCLDRHDYALGHFLEHTVDAFTHFDFKVPKALWSLLRHPGAMTADVLAGRRVNWAKPMQVFLIANVVYYVTASTLHLSTFETQLRYHLHAVYGSMAQAWSSAQAAKLGLTDAAYAARFDGLAHTLAKTLVIFFVPAFALLFGLIERSAKRYALEHVTAALHFTSALLLLLPLPFPLIWGLVKSGMVPPTAVDASWSLVTALMLGLYASVFTRRVYGVGRGAAFGQSVLIVWWFYAALAFLYRPLLFFFVHALL